MKRTSTFKLAVAFIGVFLGAGFVSGQELWQFFACFGIWGFPGFLVSVFLMFLVDYALLHAAGRLRTTDIGKLILPGDHPKLCALIDAMQCLLLFGILVIMVAGASTLLKDMTGLHPAICGVLFVLVVLLAAMFELRGVITVFSVLVPVTCALAVMLGIAILMGLSRLYLYVHWPTDILGGIVVGWCAGWLGATVVLWLVKRYEQYRAKEG